MLYHETDQERIVTMAEVLHQGRYIKAKTLKKIQKEAPQYPWWKVAIVLDALQARIDEERPWKMRKAVSRYTIQEAVELSSDPITAPF